MAATANQNYLPRQAFGNARLPSAVPVELEATLEATK